MAAVTTLRFMIEHEGADVFIAGTDRRVTFNSARGRFAAPASADAVIGVSAGAVRTEIGAVAIDGRIWITEPLTGRWVRAPDAFAFDPSRIFRADVGLRSLIADGLTGAALTSSQPDGEGRYHVTARVAPARVAKLTSGLVTDVQNAEFWIDADTYLLSEMRFAVPLDRGDTRWILRLSDYGSDVTISEPPTD